MNHIASSPLPALPVPIALPALSSSPRTARLFLREALTGHVTPEVLSDIEVMATELVTNAVLKARTLCELSVTVADDDILRVAVRDGDSTPPVMTPTDGSANGGRGLHIIEALAENWGTQPHPPGGKTVWFEIRI